MSTGEHSKLPRLLGYAELDAESGWKKRTVRVGPPGQVEEAWHLPGIYPGGKAAWHHERLGFTAPSVKQKWVGVGR